VAIWNCDLAPAEAVTDSVTFTVRGADVELNYIYLPLVVRNF